MHRETVVARELKLLKNKFDLLEKSRQFRSILHKSKDNNNSTTNNNLTVTSNNSEGVDDNASELISLAGDSSRRPSFTNDDCNAAAASGNSALGATSRKAGTGASLLHKLRLAFGSIASSLIGCGDVTGASVNSKASSRRRKTKVAPMMGELPGEITEGVLPAAQSETT